VRATASPDFGTLLRHYRLIAGLSQEALAERARLSTEGISALERGFRRTPQRGTLALLIKALALDAETRDEFEAAAARGVLLGKAGAAAVVPWFGSGPNTLPVSLATFVGRDKELKEIARLLRDNRLVTLTGAGGIGKTQTVLQVAKMQRTDGSAPCFVALASVADPSLVTTAIASALRVEEVPDRPLIDTVTGYLKDKSALLILDNCEHVIVEAAHLTEAVLAGCSQVRILATSREPLRVPGERRYRLPSLSMKDATDLFHDRAQAVNHAFGLNENDAKLVAELCRRLDGIPLAIELAAARVDTLTVATLDKLLDDRFRVLSGGARTVLPRQQTMRATIDWSYDALSSQEQLIFDRLSIFAGGCTLATATIVCSDGGVAENNVTELLLSLVDKSLVTVDMGAREPRYRLLESFRQYASENLATRGQTHALAHRHASAYLNLAEELYVAWDTEPDRQWVECARAEMENWRRALEFSLVRRCDVSLGQTLVAKLVFVWLYLAPAEGRRWITQAQNLVGESTVAQTVAGLRLAEALVTGIFEDRERELAASIDAFDIYRSLGDEFGMVCAESHWLRGLTILERFAGLEEKVAALIARARKLELRKELAHVLRVAAMVSTNCGHFTSARRRLAEAREIARDCGAEREAAWVGLDAACCEFAAGDMELAVEYASEALQGFRAVHDSLRIAWCSDYVSQMLYLLGRYDAAEDHARETLTIASALGAGAFVLSALRMIALIAGARSLSARQRERTYLGKGALILGFLSRSVSTAGVSTDLKHDYDRARDLLETAMGKDEFGSGFTEGALLTEEQAIHLALGD